jgi:hypothetical protein
MASIPYVIPRYMILMLLPALLATADSGPQPPCGGETFPEYPDVGNSPVVKVWNRSVLGHDWVPPACTGWTTPGFSTLVVTVARFQHSGDAPSLLRRIAAISELAGMRYWSTTHKRWQTLIPAAWAVSSAAGDKRRADFSADEMAEGSVLYFHQEDNLSGKAVYQIRIAKVSPERLLLSIENITTMRFFLLPLFQPGEMQSIYFIDRESPDVWRYYSIVRMGKNASSLVTGHDASSINRAVAFYRHFAGIPTDKEPPAAP